MTAMDLKITEDWIKKRVNLEDENPGDVKALALPGSYHEKIASLGVSLSNFSRLKQLDLSKNSIATLEGLEHLKYLEELNLYYNQIPDLKEVFRLRKNQALREVDLRLNPVTKTEPDYRLFVVHMLPILRKLDDRSVRDTERKAALMHFTSDDALEMTDKPNHDHDQPRHQEIRQPRAEYVNKMVRKPTVVTENDRCTDVIDEMNRPKGLTGSKVKESYSTKHQHDEMLKISEEAISKHAAQNLTQKQSTISVSKKSAPMREQISNGHTTDEDLNYDKYTSVANFTPHPGVAAQTPPKSYNGASNNQENYNTNEDYSDTNNSLILESRRLNFGDSMEERVATRQTQVQAQSDFVDDFLDLVDKYWNGSKSLHYHKKFRSLIQKPLDQFVEMLSSSGEAKVKFYQQKMASLEKDNHDLNARMHAVAKQQHGLDHKDAEISNLHGELDSTRSRLQNCMNENKKMRGKIRSLEEKLLLEQDSQNSRTNKHEMELEKQKKSLVQQVAQLKLQVKNFEKLDQLTKMLQESHKSLMMTNERLVNDLEETRSRHLVEIEQLKWSYDQLKKTNTILNSSTEHTNGYS